MKKITLLFAFAAMVLAGCSGDDSDPVTEPDSFSAHMQTECPSNSETPIYDICVSESVYEYLGEQREARLGAALSRQSLVTDSSNLACGLDLRHA